jgi:hypothetical protein
VQRRFCSSLAWLSFMLAARMGGQSLPPRRYHGTSFAASSRTSRMLARACHLRLPFAWVLHVVFTRHNRLSQPLDFLPTCPDDRTVLLLFDHSAQPIRSVAPIRTRVTHDGQYRREIHQLKELVSRCSANPPLHRPHPLHPTPTPVPCCTLQAADRSRAYISGSSGRSVREGGSRAHRQLHVHYLSVGGGYR